MTKDHDEPTGICVNCMAELADKIAHRAVANFTDLHSDVKMSFNQWIDLIETIEEEIRDAFGVDDDEAEETAADVKATVQ